MPTSRVRISKSASNNRAFRDIFCHASLLLVAVRAGNETSASGRGPALRGRRTGLFEKRLQANETSGNATVMTIPSLVEGYPDCNVERPSWIGDGVCDCVGGYNTSECGWDGGDCLAAIWVALDCCRDGGDCLDEPGSGASHSSPPAPAAVEGHPDCHVENQYWIGDGVCDCVGGYNTAECGWDGGDCLADTDPCGSYSYYDDYASGSHYDDDDDINSGLGFIFFIAPALVLLANLANVIKKHRGRQQETMDPDLPAFRREQTSRRSARPVVPDASAPTLAELSERTSRHEVARLHLQTCAFGSDESPPISEPTAPECDETDHSEEELAAADGEETKAEPECSICLDRFEKDDEVAWSKSPDCNHSFHSDCILQWLSSKRRNGSMHDSCPLCRHQIIPSGQGAA